MKVGYIISSYLMRIKSINKRRKCALMLLVIMPDITSGNSARYYFW